MGVGGTQIKLLPSQARLAVEPEHGLFLDSGGDNEGISADDDAETILDAESNGFDKERVMNASGGFSAAAAVACERQGAEVA